METAERRKRGRRGWAGGVGTLPWRQREGAQGSRHAPQVTSRPWHAGDAGAATSSRLRPLPRPSPRPTVLPPIPSGSAAAPGAAGRFPRWPRRRPHRRRRPGRPADSRRPRPPPPPPRPPPPFPLPRPAAVARAGSSVIRWRRWAAAAAAARSRARLCSTGTWSRGRRRGGRLRTPRHSRGGECRRTCAPPVSGLGWLMFILGERSCGAEARFSPPSPPGALRAERLAFPTWPSPPGRSSLRKHTQWPGGFPWSALWAWGIRAAVVEQEAINRGRDSGLVREGHGWLKAASLASPLDVFLIFGGGRVGGGAGAGILVKSVG